MKSIFGVVPWDLYDPVTLFILGGLSHVLHVYLLASSALRGLGSEMEEAARVTGARPLQIALNVSLPLITPALLYSAVLVFVAGFSMFGLALALGNPSGFEVLSVYLFKLGTRLRIPSYQLMAVVAVCFVAVTFPLVMLQRRLLKASEKYVTVRGRSGRQRPVPLGIFQMGSACSGPHVVYL